MTSSDVKELVERLLREADLADQVEQSTVFGSPRTSREAASALTLLSEEREELREALRPFAEMATDIEHAHAGSDLLDVSTIPLPLGDLRRARAALKKGS